MQGGPTWLGTGRGVLGGGLLLLAAGCVPNSASQPWQPHWLARPATTAAPDPQDSCGPQVVVFVNSGDLFATPPRRSGPPTADQLAEELARENAALERLQIAFDALMYCRWTEVRVIRADAASGAIPQAELPRRLGAAEGRLRRDLSRATATRQAIAARSARIEQAVEAVAPGTRAAAAASRPAEDGQTRATASAPIPLRGRPDADAPIVGRLDAGAQVSVRRAPGGFVQADGGPGLRGYAPSNAFTVLTDLPETAGTDRLRRLTATNIARRDAFTQSVELANRSGVDGFEPAT